MNAAPRNRQPAKNLQPKNLQPSDIPAKDIPAKDIPESDRQADLPHPRHAPELIGHGGALRAFASALASGRLPHAWLLTGIQGIGKATLAYRMARYVLHHGARAAPAATDASGRAEPDVSVPEESAAARLVASLAHPDLCVLRRPWDSKAKRFKTVITAADVRRATGLFHRSAGQGGFRVCIADAAEDMSLGAANALLKTLEEPPPGSLFILVSHHWGRLPATICSRCRRLALRPLSEACVARIAAQHLPGLEAAQVEALARLSGGSAGDALAMAGTGGAGTGGAGTGGAGTGGAGSGLDLCAQVDGLLDGLPNLDAMALHELAARVGARGSEGLYRMFSVLLGNRLAHRARTAAPGASARAQGPAHQLRWARAWGSASAILERARTQHLARRQAVLGAFAAIESAWE